MIVLRGRREFYVSRYGGRWSAPSMAAALAGVIHDRQRTDNQEPNRGQDNQNGGFHRDLDHCEAPEPSAAGLTKFK